ncbi:flagellar basal body protein FliL [Breznakiella homolactica]|uniref:Flagellar basal body protein FliL n=1 Tax=Breznakiella homolactica TaxID=2798577 RepID=A0A7T7XN60_9SPIR|nr:flagellar basal body protein FliL [Breznakiella homolactica]QQO09429.1 flagellar basal body protein FliL [Breznakiella homolactica]
MKRTQDRESPGMLILYRILLAAVLLLGIVILCGTLYGLFFRPGGSVPAQTSPAGAESGGPDDRVFTGIGRIRAVTADSPPAAVILSVSFPYDPGDRVFTEELVSRLGDFRSQAVSYLESFSAGELRLKTEPVIKEELLGRYNALLRLGKIDVLYFNDFMIIE